MFLIFLVPRLITLVAAISSIVFVVSISVSVSSESESVDVAASDEDPRRLMNIPLSFQMSPGQFPPSSSREMDVPDSFILDFFK